MSRPAGLRDVRRRAVVAAVLQAFAALDGTATRPQVEGRTGYHEESVRFAVEDLVAAGVLRPVDAARRCGGRGRRYRLVAWPAWAGERPPPDPAPPPRLAPAPRRCLGCGVDFESEWCGHRLCERCSSAADGRHTHEGDRERLAREDRRRALREAVVSRQGQEGLGTNQ